MSCEIKTGIINYAYNELKDYVTSPVDGVSGMRFKAIQKQNNFYKALAKVNKDFGYTVAKLEKYDNEYEDLIRYNVPDALVEQYKNTPGKVQYYQTQSTKTKEIAALKEHLIGVLANLGVSVSYQDEVKAQDGSAIVAKANSLKKLIEVARGLADELTLPEEAAHIVTQLLGREHPLMVSMMKKIDRFTIYKDTYEEYKDKYTNEDGTPDIDKIKEEAIGKLISQHIVKQYKGEENISSYNLGRNWWESVKKVLKGLLKSVNLNDLANAINLTEYENSEFSFTADLILRGDLKEGDLRFNDNEVNAAFRITNIIGKNIVKIESLFKQLKDTDTFWNKIQKDYQIPTEQLKLLRDSDGNNIQKKLVNFLSNYSYTVEINTATQKTNNITQIKGTYFELDGIDYTEAFGAWFKNEGTTKISYKEYKEALDKYNQQNIEEKPTQHYSYLTVPGGTNYTENAIRVPGVVNVISAGGEYHDNQFNQSRGDMAGWFRSDDKTITEKSVNKAAMDAFGLEDENESSILKQIGVSKTRRILEVQSGLFQKGRDKENLNGKVFEFPSGQFNKYNYNGYDYFTSSLVTTGETKYTKRRPGTYDNIELTREQYEQETNQKFPVDNRKQENQFLQLLNKDNNWVTFFIKSIIQDSAKKGYEKVLFPSGNTASKVEGHTTLEEFKKEKEDRIKTLENKRDKIYTTEDVKNFSISDYMLDSITDEQKIADVKEDAQIEISQLKQELERVEKEGFGALKPIYNFYENTVTNILINQIYGKDSEFVNYEFTFNNDKYERLNDKNQYLKNGKEITQKEFNQVRNSVTKQDKKDGKFTDKYYVNFNALITDEYGNTWNEVTIIPEHNNTIFYQTKSANTQQDIVNSITSFQSKVTKDENATSDRYTVNGEKGYKSATEVAREGKINRFTKSTAMEAGSIVHNVLADIIAEAFPAENKHIKRLTAEEQEKYGMIRRILKDGVEGLAGRSGGIGQYIKTVKDNGGILLGEVIVANSITKRVGTIDLLQVDKDGKTHIMDYKTTYKSGLSKTAYKEYSIQVEEYVKILENGDPSLGIIPTKVANRRLLPISLRFNKSDKIISATFLDEKPLRSESTEITSFDKFIKRTMTQIEVLEKKLSGETNPVNKVAIREKIDVKEKLIEQLQIKRHFSVIVNNALKDLRYIENVIQQELNDDTDFKDMLTDITFYSNIGDYVDSSTLNKEDIDAVTEIAGKAKALSVYLNKAAADYMFKKAGEAKIIGKEGAKTKEEFLSAKEPTGVLKRLLHGVSFTHHPIVYTVKRVIDEALSVAREQAISIHERIKNATDKLQLRGNLYDTYNKYFLQRREDGSLTGNLVGQHKHQYWIERAEAIRSNNTEWFKNNTVFDQEAYDKATKNQEAYYDSIKKQYVQDKIYDLTSSIFGLSKEEARQMAEESFLRFKEFSMEDWRKANKTLIRFGKPMDIWIDPMYKEIQDNADLKEFYDLFKEVTDMVRDLVPEHISANFIPNFTKDFIEKAATVGVSAITDMKKDFLESMELKYDETKYGSFSAATGEPIYAIPVAGLSRMDLTGEKRKEWVEKNKSYDLGTVLFFFAESAYKYQQLSTVENVAAVGLSIIQNQDEVVLDATGKPLEKGITEKQSNLNTYKMLKDYVDGTLYQNKRDAGDTKTIREGGTVTYGGLFDNILRYVSLRNLGLNIVSPAVDLLANRVNGYVQAVSGKFFSVKDYKFSIAALTAGKYSTSNEEARKAYLFTEVFDVLQEEFKQKYSKELTAIKAGKVFNPDLAFSLFHIADWANQNSTLIAMLKSGKYDFKWDDFKVENDKLVYKDGTKIDSQNKEHFRQKVMKVNKLIVGNYDANDTAAMKRYWYGRVLLQHRGWIPAQFEQRWGAKRYDYDLDMYIEGRYKTLTKQIKDLIVKHKVVGVSNWWKDMSDEDKANMRSNFLELSALATISIILLALKGGDDDKEQRKSLAYPIKVLGRLRQEMVFFYGPSFYDILISPAASVSVIEDVFKAGKSAGIEIFGDEKQKKENNLTKKAVKMVPLGNQGYRIIDEFILNEDNPDIK